MGVNLRTKSRSAERGGKSIENSVDSIYIDGSFVGQRYLVKINDKEVLFTPKSFKYFITLAFHLKNGNGRAGWVKLEDLEQGYNQAKYIYRMKGEMKEAIGGSAPSIENNRMGNYRLAVENPEVITFNAEILKEDEDLDIRKFFIKINPDKKY